MDELTTALHDARHTIDPAWDTSRTRKARDAFHGRLRRRRRARIAVAIATPVLALLVVLGVRLAPGRDTTREHLAHAGRAARPGVTGPRTIDAPFRFWDGSRATPIGVATHLRASEVSQSRIVIDVDHGSGRFEVTPNLRTRAFIVRAHGVTVRVVGTVFTVGAEGERTRVVVEHGRVSVEWTGGRASLGDGESGLFPPVEGEAGAPVPDEGTPVVDDGAQEAAPAAPRVDRNWRRLAESGDFSEAFEALRATEVRDRPEELLLAADAARLSSHPREALTYYQRVVRDHAGDPRAPLAAFTMGRVLLTQLGRPRDAANAFARARSLAGSGSLAEDALAREVEARSVAGETERAHSLAEQYVARYPAGQRIRAVRRFGGLP